MQNNTFSTLFVGQNLIRLSAVDSTNNFLKMMVSNSEPLPEGTVIMADDQFAGRGQQGNTWHSIAGLNLTFSILLKPIFLSVSNQFRLNMAVSIAISKALEVFVPQGIKIKWPNDIYFQDRKLGGVLIENNILGGALKTSIIGIGINVNQEVFDASKVKYATSLREILQQDVDLIKLLREICTEVERQYLSLRSSQYGMLRESYLSRVYRYEQEALYRDDRGVFAGFIRGINENGQLILDIDGSERIYSFKEVEFLI